MYANYSSIREVTAVRDVKPFVIGLCGRSGAGKSFVSRLFGRLDIPSVDTDAVYREMTSAPADGKLSDCMRELVSEFGEGILADDKSLDRRALAAVVFGDGGKEKLGRLNEITHKYILGETEKRIERFAEDGAWAVIVDAPLLFESGFDKKCDYIVAASAPENVLLKRIVARDSINTEAAMRRLAAQIADGDVRRRADFVIETDATEEKLKKRVARVISAIREDLKTKGEN